MNIKVDLNLHPLQTLSHLCMCVHGCMRTHTCSHACRGQKKTSSTILQVLSTLSLKTRSGQKGDSVRKGSCHKPGDFSVTRTHCMMEGKSPLTSCSLASMYEHTRGKKTKTQA